jgi:hypothetical protein
VRVVRIGFLSHGDSHLSLAVYRRLKPDEAALHRSLPLDATSIDGTHDVCQGKLEQAGFSYPFDP